MPNYRVVILDRAGEVLREAPVAARSAPRAAFEATGEDLMRSEKGNRYWLRAKVYSQVGATPSMTRFYSRAPASVPSNQARHDETAAISSIVTK